jgi:hypothetical protein
VWRRTLDIPLFGTFLYRRSLFFALRLSLLLIVLSHDGITRLVAVFLVLQLLLPLHLSWIPVS